MTCNQSNPLVRISLVLSLFLAAFCSSSKAADPCDLSALPQEVHAKLDKDYADWQPERLDNLDEFSRTDWTKTHPKDCPGIAIGHFESKTFLSYAFLLISKPDKKHFGFHVVVLSRTEDSPLVVSHVVVESERGDFAQSSNFVIARAPPHEYEPFDDDSDAPRKVTIHLNGILYEAIGQASSLFYWDHSHYKSLSLSD